MSSINEMSECGMYYMLLCKDYNYYTIFNLIFQIALFYQRPSKRPQNLRPTLGPAPHGPETAEPKDFY